MPSAVRDVELHTNRFAFTLRSLPNVDVTRSGLIWSWRWRGISYGYRSRGSEVTGGRNDSVDP